MNDDALAEQLGEKLMAEHLAAHPGMKAGPYAGKLGDVFKRLRSLNIPWSKILAMVGPIIQILLTGGGWEAIIAAVLDLFGAAPTA